MIVQRPPIGLWHDARHRYTVNGTIDGEPVSVGPLISVTTAIDVLSKPQLVGWATRETAAAAVRNLDAVRKLAEKDGPAAAEAWLRTMPGRLKDSSANLGTRIHEMADALGHGQSVEVTEAERARVEQYVRWMEETYPEYVGIEQQVVNLSEGYGGTADLFVAIDGTLWLLDIKTGRGLYPEMALQLAALNRAEYWGSPGKAELTPALRAERCGILHLRDDGYRLVETAAGDDEYHAFLACLALKRYFATADVFGGDDA